MRTLIPLLVLALWAGVAWAAQAGPAESAPALVQQGDAQWQAGDLDAALASYGRAARAAGDDPTAHLRAAGVHMARQDYRKGIESFQEAVAADRSNAGAFIGMAIGYMHLGEYGPAHAALEEAVRLDPGKFKRVEPLLERIERRMPHPVPRPDESDRALEAQIRGMR